MTDRTLIVFALLLATAPPALAQQTDPVRVGLGRSVSVGIGGQLRERYEAWDGFNFSAPATADHQDDFLLTRALVHGRLSLGERATAFVQIKSSLATYRSLLGGRRAIDVDELDVQQAWAELRLGGGARSMLRVGRQDLALGRERLVSPLDWVNTRRTFEGAQVLLSGLGGGLRAFVMRPVRVFQYAANEGDTLQWIAGLYQTVARGTRGRAVDVYYFHNVNDAAAFNGTAGREVRSTLGGRLYTRGQSRWDYDVEGAVQFGTLGGQDIRASMVSAQVGLNVPTLPGAPRFNVGYDFASGDDQSGGDVGTFNQLFPLGHAFLGYIDIHGRQNVVAVSGGVDAQAFGRVTVALTAHRFWRQSQADGLYGVAGGLTRGPGASLPTGVGSEVDLTLRWPAHRRVLFQTGYSRYFAGAFIEQSGPATDVAFGYGSVTLTW